jgi:hypothetical protein
MCIGKRFIIECIGRNGKEEKFLYSVDYNESEETWIYRVYSIESSTKEFFEFHVRRINETTGKVVMMIHHNVEAYIAKGIPERMIEEAHTVLNLEIMSSTNSEENKMFENEYITDEAKKVWKRLLDKGKAFWDENDRVFYFKAK